jgi:hypothetical protein
MTTTQPDSGNEPVQDAAIKSMIDRWPEARKERETKAQFEQELREYVRSEQEKLLERLKANSVRLNPMEDDRYGSDYTEEYVNVDDIDIELAKLREG